MRLNEVVVVAPKLAYDFASSELEELKSLKLPREVKGNLSISHNLITSLDGCSEIVRGTFACSNNPHLTSLEGSPTFVQVHYNASRCPKLKLTGSPKIVVGAHAYISSCNLTSLKDIHKVFAEVGNSPSVNGKIFATDNPITSHVLGLLKIKGLKNVALITRTSSSLDLLKVEKIINRRLGAGDLDLLACQEELMDAGLEDFAQL